MFVPFLSVDITKIAEPIVVLRPIHQRDIASKRSSSKVSAIDQAAVKPKVWLAAFWMKRIKSHVPVLQRLRLGCRKTEEFPRPRRAQFRRIFTPERIFSRLLDRMVFAIQMVH